MKKFFLIIIAIVFMAAPLFVFGQQETSTKEKTQEEKPISYTFINEYGFYGGPVFGFSGIFVNGIRFNKTQDVVGLGIGYEIDSRPYQDYFRSGYSEGAQSVPVFINYRHYFPSKKKLKPLVNIGIGMRINFWRQNTYYDLIDDWYPVRSQKVDAGLYGTMAAGFKVRAFSFTSGFFLKSWNKNYFGGVEVKVGFAF
jgi:hypothetical protein